MLSTSALSVALLGLASLFDGALAASAGCGKAATLRTGVQRVTAKGKSRQYTLQLPAGYDPSHPYRVVFQWHGANDNMDVTVRGTLVQPPGSFPYFGLQSYANNSTGAILVAPDALNKAWYNRNDEDYAFFDAMLEQLSAGLCIDEKKVFSIGFSHGGAFAKALSCKRASSLRGVIILDGGGPIDGSSGCVDDPMAAMVVHGVSDGIQGGRSTRDLYVKRNGCAATNAREPAANSRAPHILTEYQGCKEGFPVWYVAFDGQHWMAPWDGGSGNNGEKTFTPAVAWRFITQFE
ncbi:carbohydrate esterase family 1 protein [Podospora aff. communis PSN243]|uniref:Feruloyl esterase C n=1 Tax=Podospora aff. communis PSN243 TaxID=3040156 RepID=A0AAV9G5Q5_9PEZI|nr:carbohydrate esterase family 1 protein [Podospora aff. communis PSN243]